jgi:hypothetical protein
MPLYSLYKRVLRHIDLLDRMMTAMDVRPAVRQIPDGPELLRNAAHRCLTCSSADRCTEFLDATEHVAEAPEYCRNKDLLDRLRQMVEPSTQAA